MRKNSLLFLLLMFLPSIVFPQEILSLEEAIRIGLNSSYSIQIAKNNIDIARNNNSLGNAGYLPRFDFSVNQSNSFLNSYRENSDGTSQTISSNPSYNLTTGVQLSWTVFDGFAMFIRKERLNVIEQQWELQLRMAVENTIAEIVYTYYNIALNKKLSLYYEEQLSLSKQRLLVAQEKARIGVGYELQVLQAEVDFRADSAQFLRQRNRILNLKADLNRLLNQEPDFNFMVNISIPVPNPANANDIFRKVMDNSTALQNARLLEQIAELELNEMKSLRWPSVNLFSTYNLSQTGTPEGQVQTSRSLGPTVGIGASIALFNGFNAHRRIENARIYAENQMINQEDLAMKLKSSAFKMVNLLNQAIELVLVEEKSVALAQRNAEAAWERFQLGSISDLELRESQNKLIDAQTRLVQAQMNAQAAEIEILSITGDMSRYLIEN